MVRLVRAEVHLLTKTARSEDEVAKLLSRFWIEIRKDLWV